MLFRKEVVDHQNKDCSFGVILLRSNRIVVFFSLMSGVVCVAIIIILFTFNYTQHTTVTGKLVPKDGLAQVMTPQYGTLIERKVLEGQQVEQGQVLFVVSSERVTRLGESTASVMQSLRSRRDSIKNDLIIQDKLSDEQRKASQQRLRDMQEQLPQMLFELKTQQRRVESAKVALDRYKTLEKMGFAPALQVQQREDDLLEQQAKLATLERAAGELRSQISSISSDLHAQPLKDAGQRANVERLLSAVDQEINETESRRELLILAPVAGRVTSIQTERGQVVTPGQTIASVIPRHSPLQAQFFAPTSAIGFVRVGQRVQLRYKAFPYQKFGQYAGEVVDVSRAAVQTNVSPPGVTSEPLYRITVMPETQSVLAYGRREPLQADMLIDADVLQDTRTIIEWIFEPLLSIKGKL